MKINEVFVKWLCQNCDQATSGDWPTHTPNSTRCRKVHKGFSETPLRNPHTGHFVCDQIIEAWPEHQWKYVAEED